MASEEAGFLAKWAGVIVTGTAAYATAGLTLWRNATGRIKAIEERVETKADKATVADMGRNLSQAFQNQREDQERPQRMIGKLTDSVHSLETRVIEELGKRPTRAEIAEQRHG